MEMVQIFKIWRAGQPSNHILSFLYYKFSLLIQQDKNKQIDIPHVARQITI